MDKSYIALTAQEAAQITSDWQQNSGLVMIKGSVFATHQICSISRVPKDQEQDLCEIAGIDYKDVPTIEKFLINQNGQIQASRGSLQSIPILYERLSSSKYSEP